jgi:hypothetical protein
VRSNALTITYLRLDEVRPYAGAARRNNRAQLRKLGNLIERFGQLPIIVDQNHVTLMGTRCTPSCASLGRSRSPW